MKSIFINILILSISVNAYSLKNKTAYLNKQDVLTVFTKPGYSTKLIFDSKPKPGLIGDQDAFNIQYLGKVVSIKPLILGSESNLFIPTKKGSFSFKLISSNKSPDNIINVKKVLNLIKKPITKDRFIADLKITKYCKDIKLSIDQIISIKGKWLIIDLKISKNKPFKKRFKAKKIGSIYLLNNNISYPIIDHYFFNKMNSNFIYGQIAFDISKLMKSKSISLYFKPTQSISKKCSFVEINIGKFSQLFKGVNYEKN